MKRTAVAAAILMLLPLLAVRAGRLVRDTARATTMLATTSPEERRLLTYGDCESLGYGYLTRIIGSSPDPQIRPAVKYGDWDRHGNVVLPSSRWEVDDRLLVGVDIADADLAPRLIQAQPLGRDATAPTWAFRTGFDFDLLNGFQLSLADPAATDRAIAITMYSDWSRRTTLGQWSAVLSAGGGALTIPVDPPVERFSIGRGGMDFVAVISGAPFTAVAAEVQLVDLRRHTIVHRSASCFTAIRQDVVQQSEWQAWVSRLQP